MNSGKNETRSTFPLWHSDVYSETQKEKSVVLNISYNIVFIYITPMSAAYRVVSNKNLELFDNLLLNCFIIITIITKRHVLCVFFSTVFHKLTCIILAIVITRRICNVIIVSANDRLFFQHRHNISYVLHRVIYFVFVSKRDNAF